MINTNKDNVILDIAHAQRPFSGDTVLLYYDGPLLFTIPNEDGSHYLFAGLEPEAGVWPFVVAHLSVEQYKEFYEFRLTVANAFLQSPSYLVRDYGDEKIILEPLERVPQNWLPGDVMWLSTDEQKAFTFRKKI
jgi:hypothetical protein